MGELEACKLSLARSVAGERKLGEVPVVERAMAIEFERAERMGHTFNRIALAMRPVVGRIDVPAVASSVVWLMSNAVHHWVAELHIFVLHVDLRPKDARTFIELAVPHFPKQVEVLLNGS